MALSNCSNHNMTTDWLTMIDALGSMDDAEMKKMCSVWLNGLELKAMAIQLKQFL